MVDLLEPAQGMGEIWVDILHLQTSYIEDLNKTPN